MSIRFCYAALVLALSGFSAVLDQSSAMLPDNKASFQINGPPQNYPIGQVYFQGTTYDYIDFGNRSVVYGPDIQAAPVWIIVSGFDDEGRPTLIEGQRVIFDRLPGDQEYSDLKRVNYVVVPSNYILNSHTDARSVRGNFTETSSAGRVYVNYPVVTRNSTVERGMVRVSKGWYQGEEVHYFDMGLTFGNATVAYQPQDSDGNPSATPVTSTAPGQLDYTAFWKTYPILLPPSANTSNLSSVEAMLTIASRTYMPTPFTIYNRPLLRLNATPEDNSTFRTSDVPRMKADSQSQTQSSNAGGRSPLLPLQASLATLLLLL
ncbi:hypothetical protein DSO57_1032515 [Entomophthora muscae]|uniref:Uncharacterized protein n=1 Tax=Entomophthora muscae TaxID=34485 RepID=A0ACC2T081_9FUNG|nr:hypothetical protein DSO57_1032515 [Entomophthora muscae]